MKTFTITTCCFMTILLLSGCSENLQTSNINQSELSSKQLHIEATELKSNNIPIGRWFHNPMHCEGKLPLNGPYDFTVDKTGIKYLGIQNKGKWLTAMPLLNTELLETFLANEGNCINVDKNKLVYLQYDSKGIDYSLIHEPIANYLFRISDDSIQLLVPFNKESIAKLTIIEDIPDALSATGIDLEQY